MLLQQENAASAGECCLEQETPTQDLLRLPPHAEQFLPSFFPAFFTCQLNLSLNFCLNFCLNFFLIFLPEFLPELFT